MSSHQLQTEIEFKASLDRDTKRGFEEMNQALKVRAEANEARNNAMEPAR